MWRWVALLSLAIILGACNNSLRPIATATHPARTQSSIILAQDSVPTIAAVPTLVIVASATPTVERIDDCPAAPTSRLILQERGRVTDDDDERLRIRRGPGTDYDQVTLMEPGALFFVLDGPVCSDIYAWYRVRFGAIEGWVAEGDFDGYFTEVFLPG